MGRCRVHGGHAGRTIGFIKCRLKLDRRDSEPRRQSLRNRSDEEPGNAIAASGKALEEACRELIGTGVDAHDNRVAGSLHRLEQSVDEVHESLLRFGLG